jgi:hypothetical protein
MRRVGIRSQLTGLLGACLSIWLSRMKVARGRGVLLACGAFLAVSGAGLMPYGALAQTPAPKTIPELILAAREAVRGHSDALRVGLHEALKNGGPKAAIGACTSLAPEIDGRIAEQSGFEIGRTALKIRNPENTPDDWERAQLEAFVKKLASGADHKALETHEVQTTSEGQKLFRYMRPIMMGDACLACHGPAVAQDVKAEIARAYNDDKAVGFTVGEMRGAFSLLQVID